MASFIEIISTLKQKNGLDFPIVDSNDIKGGVYQVESIQERDSIPTSRRKEGLICWVKGNVFYQLIGGIENSNWKEITLSSNGGSGTGGSSLNRSDIEWVGLGTPSNQDVIWFDPSNEGIEEVTYDNPIIQELISTISALNDRILVLETKLENVIIGGGNGGSTDSGIYLMLEDGTNLLLEDGGFIVLENS